MNNRENGCIISKKFRDDGKFFLRSLIYIKKKRGPEMEPWGLPAIIGKHVYRRLTIKQYLLIFVTQKAPY